MSVLELSGVSKRFGGLQALSGISLSVAPGEVLGLIGPNGAGKSTLVSCITGVLRIDGGAIRFGDRDIGRLPPHQRARRGIARTFQKVRLADQLTVYENVAAGLASQWFSRASGWPLLFQPLSATGIADAVNRTLEQVGLTDVSAMTVKSLPFGRRHFVEIARAIVAKPSLLLLDEPATGLTESERERLAALVKAIAGSGCAQILIEHDLELVGRLCHRVTVINQGNHVFTGTPAAAQVDPEVVRAYLGMNQLISGGADDARG
jgi:ABC-type branched-subunit amino acid transport system ATPase component